MPKIIENLKDERSIRYNLEKTKLGMDIEFYKQKETELEEKLRNEIDIRFKQRIEYEDAIKTLKEENDFLRNTKEKVFILREGR